MSFLIETPADQARRDGLRRMRIVATSALLVAAVVYLLTLRLPHDGVWGFVNTASEAAMVGALADWFAVTALFKHPLGLPIPHTALVKRRKDELGRSLQEFVASNFLTEEIARERLASAQVGLRLGRWLERPESRERVMRESVTALRAGLNRMQDSDVEDFLTDLLLPRLAREPISPIAGSLLEKVVEERTHDGLVDLGLDQVLLWLRDNPEIFAEVMVDKAPWWTPNWVDDRVIAWAYEQAVTWLREMRADTSHPARTAVDDLLRRLAHDLQHDEEVQASAERIKERLLAHPQVSRSAVAVWQSIRSALLSAMDDRDSYFWRRGDELLSHVGEHLVNDPRWRDRLETHLGEGVAFAVNTYGDELAEVISVTVERWDADEASKRIELYVGRDLQFIRINGTVIGALAGLVIHTVSVLLT
ncbi:DUF445 domain-containing protein [Marihabitans asiaticum]|uniref:Uncharacterized membrane-anchored protein YjiN (DUF445 family) n=1 Tax=Marihabitans asiaticum TaxID=415218 RepID=A0A560WHN2_9MICO|nr:DUF445 domain-containing protein [Marihabitans asiaticum]TWD16965.1 uncharacterized membrane-anchored protein YjiN (DUF445 family) [Marihabitans asiaticum]